jgi:hypothetical protein
MFYYNRSNQIKSLKSYSDMKAFSLDFIDISSNQLSNSDSNKLIYSDLISRISEVDISNNLLQSTPITKHNASLPSGRIYKINQTSTQLNCNPKPNIPVHEINLCNSIANVSTTKKIVSPSNDTKGEVPLLLELEQMYQSRCKSNATNKHYRMNSDVKSIQCLSPLSREQLTPSRPIWSRWGKQRLSIPSPSELKEFQ